MAQQEAAADAARVPGAGLGPKSSPASIMLDFFTIFSKGGLVLWCFQGVSDSCTGPVNALIRSVLLQERGGNNSFTHEALTLKYKLDNQFELVFVVGFQKILTLTYVDKLIDDVHRLFRDKYRTEIQQQSALSLLNGTFDFQNDFLRLLREAEESSKIRAPTTMKKFEDSEKAKKPVRSMIETRGEKTKEKAKNNKKRGPKRKVLMALWLPAKQPLQKSQVSQWDLRMGNFPKRS